MFCQKCTLRKSGMLEVQGMLKKRDREAMLSYAEKCLGATLALLMLGGRHAQRSRLRLHQFEVRSCWAIFQTVLLGC